MYRYYNIREMTFEDIDKVMEIENLSFVAPWKKDELLIELKENPFAHTGVIEISDDDKNYVLAGFYDYWVTFDSATLCQIAIHPNYRKNGLASILLKELQSDWKAMKIRNVTLEVRTNNKKAFNLYKKFNFCIVLTKEKYYTNGDDAYYMVYEVK